jgi:hypothetical protein
MLAAALLSSLVLAAPAWDGVAFHPYSVDPGNTDCVAWNDPAIGTTRDCDPINLVFPGQSVADVVGRLHAAGWVDTGGTTQWLYVPPALVPVQAQLEQHDGPEPANADPTERYHIRLWEAAPGLTVGNVHHEHGSPHRIDLAWDDAESFAAAGVCATWCEHVHLTATDAIQGPDGGWRGFANDGDATVVPLAPPPTTTASPATPAPPPPVRHRRRQRRGAPDHARRHRLHRPA